MMTQESLVEEVKTLVLAMGRGEGEVTLLPLCQSVVKEVLSRLKPHVSIEDCHPEVVLACGWMVLDGLGASGGSVSASSFRVGEFSMTQSDKVSQNDNLRVRAEELMKPYFKGSRFGFYSMEG